MWFVVSSDNARRAGGRDTEMTEQRLLKGEEVADILQVSRSFAYQLLRQGDIPVVRLGRAVRVRSEDLQRFIESNVCGSNRALFRGAK
jgi:excisionase family DNA binding protein